MIEITCWTCGKHLGWIHDCGPGGMAFCDECAWEDEDKDSEDEDLTKKES